MPEVSVVIPTYNSAQYVTDAVDSVLNQSFGDLEVLVIDDGSSDETESVMGRYGAPVRYLRQQNAGVAAARNRGISESRGRYVAFLDADDTWLPDKLAKEVSALNLSRDYRACYSAFAVADCNLVPLDVCKSSREGSALEDLLLRGNVIATPSTVMCERALFAETGGFDPSLSQCADWDMWVRLATLTEFLYLDEPLVNYRLHGAQMSANVALLERDSLRVLEKGFDMLENTSPLRAQRRFAFARNDMVLAGAYFHARLFSDFLRCASRAVSLDFRQMAYILGFPLRLVKRARPRQVN